MSPSSLATEAQPSNCMVFSHAETRVEKKSLLYAVTPFIIYKELRNSSYAKKKEGRSCMTTLTSPFFAHHAPLSSCCPDAGTRRPRAPSGSDTKFRSSILLGRLRSCYPDHFLHPGSGLRLVKIVHQLFHYRSFWS